MSFASRIIWFCLFVSMITGCGGKTVEEPKPKTDRVVPITDPDVSKNGKANKVEDKTNDPKTGHDNSTTSSDAADKLDTSYIADDSIGAIVIHPRRILQSGLLPALPAVITRELCRGILDGVNPASLEQVVLFASPFTTDQLPGARKAAKNELTTTSEANENEPKETAPDSNPKPDEVDIPPPTDVPTKEKEPANGHESPDFSGLFEGLEKEPDKDPDAFEPPTADPAADGSSFGDRLGLVLRFADADAALKFNARLIREGEHFEHASRPYYRASPTANQYVFFPDAQTAVIASQERLEKMIEAKGKSASPLIQLLSGFSTKHDIVAAALVAPMLNTAQDILIDITTDENGNLYEGVPDSSTPLELVESITLSAGFGADELLSIQIKANPADSVGELKKHVESIVGFGKWNATFGLVDLEQTDFVKRELTIRLVDSLLRKIHTTSTKEHVTVTLERPDGFAEPAEELAAFGIESARRGLLRWQLKQCALAALNYHDSFRLFPDNGTFGLASEASSWRVDLLPYLDNSPLHDQYKYSEPWNGENNSLLLPAMPRVFGSSGTKTSIMVFTGEGTPFPPGGPISVSDITDGLATTIFAVRAGTGKAVPWTQPADLLFDPENPLAALGDITDEGFDVVFFDGRVATLPKDIDAETLRRLINPKDGQPVDMDSLLNKSNQP